MIMDLGNTCYCYKDECNQKEWERLGMAGSRRWVVVSAFKLKGDKVPICPYCKQRMTITSDAGYDS